MFRLSLIFGAIDDCFESFWVVQEEWFLESEKPKLIEL